MAAEQINLVIRSRLRGTAARGCERRGESQRLRGIAAHWLERTAREGRAELLQVRQESRTQQHWQCLNQSNEGAEPSNFLEVDWLAAEQINSGLA